MVISYPYIYVSTRSFARVDTVQASPPHSFSTKTVMGYHAIWAAKIPYIPINTITDADAHALGLDTSKRSSWHNDCIIHFLNNLVQITNGQATFELRFIADPRPETDAKVSIIIIGKSFAEDDKSALLLAQTQWERFTTIFPSGVPFYYPLDPVINPSDIDGTPIWECNSFAHWFEPITNQQLDVHEYSMLEIRKFEDWPSIRIVENVVFAADYIPYPYAPADDDISIFRLFDILAHQRHTAYVGITLRPQRLSPVEEGKLTQFATWYEEAANGNLTITSDLNKERIKLGLQDYNAYFKRRSKFGGLVYESLVQARQMLFQMHVRIIANESSFPSLKEAVGAMLVANASAEIPSQYVLVWPKTRLEDQWARFNMKWLEMERWGISNQLTPDMTRLRFLVTVREASSLFRFPSGSHNIQLHGMEIRDEPLKKLPKDKENEEYA